MIQLDLGSVFMIVSAFLGFSVAMVVLFHNMVVAPKFQDLKAEYMYIRSRVDEIYNLVKEQD